MINSTHHDYLKLHSFFSISPSHRAKTKGRGEKILEGKVVKAKIGELEEEVRSGNSRRMSKDLTGVV